MGHLYHGYVEGKWRPVEVSKMKPSAPWLLNSLIAVSHVPVEATLSFCHGAMPKIAIFDMSFIAPFWGEKNSGFGRFAKKWRETDMGDPLLELA